MRTGMNRLNIFAMLAALCSGGGTNRNTVSCPPSSDFGFGHHNKSSGGRARRRHPRKRCRILPGMARRAGDYFRAHPELCQKVTA